MKHSVKFASRPEPEEYFLPPNEVAAASLAQPAPAPRPLRVVNPFETDRPQGPDRDAALQTDLAAELEAALLQDLQSVSDWLDQPADAEAFPADPLPPPLAPADEAALDIAALERLMETVRQPVPKPQPETEPHRLARSAFERPEMAESADDSAGRLRPRAPATPRAPVARAAAASGRRIQSSLIVGAALIALAGGGAFVTVQSVTAQDEEPAAITAAAPAAPSEAIPAVEKVEDRAAAELPVTDADSSPVRIVSADRPAAATIPAAAEEAWRVPDPALRSTLGESAAGTTAEATAGDGAEAMTEAKTEAETAPAVEPAAVVAAVDPAPVRTGSGMAGLSPGSARITSAVKLRGNPDNGAPVVGVLSAGTDVTIVGCKGWCEVVAGDKRGFVFQKFLAQGGAG